MDEEVTQTAPTSEDAKSNVGVMNTILIATAIFFLIYYLTTRGKQQSAKPPPSPPVLIEEEAIREETFVEEQVVMVREKPLVSTATASTNTDAIVDERRVVEEPLVEVAKSDAISQTEASIIIASWTCEYCASEWRSCNLFDPHVGSPYARRYRTELKLDVKARSSKPENMMSVEMPHMLRVSVDAASPSAEKDEKEEPHVANVDVVAEEES